MTKHCDYSTLRDCSSYFLHARLDTHCYCTSTNFGVLGTAHITPPLLPVASALRHDRDTRVSCVGIVGQSALSTATRAATKKLTSSNRTSRRRLLTASLIRPTKCFFGHL